MTDFLSAIWSLGAVLGLWTAVSFATLLVLVPWFRAQSHANAVLSQRYRRQEFLVAAHPSGPRWAAGR